MNSPDLDRQLIAFMVNDVPRRFESITASVDRLSDKVDRYVQNSNEKFASLERGIATVHADLVHDRTRFDEKLANVDRRLADLDGEVGDTKQQSIITLKQAHELAQKKLADAEREKHDAEVKRVADIERDGKEKADKRSAALTKFGIGFMLLLAGSGLTILVTKLMATPPAGASTSKP